MWILSRKLNGIVVVCSWSLQDQWNVCAVPDSATFAATNRVYLLLVICHTCRVSGTLTRVELVIARHFDLYVCWTRTNPSNFLQSVCGVCLCIFRVSNPARLIDIYHIIWLINLDYCRLGLRFDIIHIDCAVLWFACVHTTLYEPSTSASISTVDLGYTWYTMPCLLYQTVDSRLIMFYQTIIIIIPPIL